MKMDRKRLIRVGVLPAMLVVGLATTAGACDSDSPSSGSQKESTNRDATYNRLVASQPAATGDWSPSRDTKNRWIKTWMQKPHKKSYMYLSMGDGKYGYYVLDGLPVSYCTSLVPTQKGARVNLGSDGSGAVVLNQPSVDGTYSSGGDCNTKYGFDAESGSYMEWTIGTNQSYFLYSEPMDLPQYENAVPLGDAKIK